MRAIVGAALFLFASSLTSAQCVVFLVPPDVPIYGGAEGANTYRGVREDYTLAFPSMKLSFNNGAMVKIEEGIQGPKSSVPCYPADFKRSKDGARVRVLISAGRAGELLEVWIAEKSSIPVSYEMLLSSLAIGFNGGLGRQSAADNLAAIRHAAELKLDKIRNADFKPPQVRTQELFVADFDKTWSALVETLSDQKWQIESIDKGSGLITTKPAIDKGGNSMTCATRFDQEHKVWLNVFVKKVEGGTRVKVNATFHALREDRAINCESNGTIEREVFKGIQENIGPAQPAQTPGSLR